MVNRLSQLSNYLKSTKIALLCFFKSNSNVSSGNCLFTSTLVSSTLFSTPFLPYVAILTGVLVVVFIVTSIIEASACLSSGYSLISVRLLLEVSFSGAEICADSLDRCNLGIRVFLQELHQIFKSVYHVRIIIHCPSLLLFQCSDGTHPACACSAFSYHSCA